MYIYIYSSSSSSSIPPIMIINRIYETQSSVAIACFLPGRAKDLSAPLYISYELSLYYVSFISCSMSLTRVASTVSKAS